ncbi:tetratricopeptide repeat protein [Mycobacterium deserti]|uniref:Tetratricopeptide repeat protein n=1 Tax=Mycobacterium deserti TaxID=2978347 RepID=A0ABT2M845_9MYCO|nr:tetratricopeptide repeat protein [Mycobacterium deserti]MCT7658437.1 tetratricopeptide repeat protein [Mycobacterium deserti]
MTLSVTTDNDHDTNTAEELDPEENIESVDDETEQDVDKTADGEHEGGGSNRGRRRLRLGAAAAIVIVGLAGSGFLGWQLWQERQIDRAGQEAQKAAVAYAEILTSIDSTKVDENFAQVLDGSTGEFKDMYSQSSMQLRQLLIDNKATAHGVVLDSAVQSATRDKVVVLLFVDQSVSNANVPDPRVDRSRIKMTMENIDNSWRASKVELP